MHDQQPTSEPKTVNHFAKLFERNGEQVVVMHSLNDDGNPCVDIHFRLPEIGMGHVTMNSKDGSDEAVQAIFDAVSEDIAFNIREQAAAHLHTSLREEG